jgi:signal transduction histidine kinase
MQTTLVLIGPIGGLPPFDALVGSLGSVTGILIVLLLGVGGVLWRRSSRLRAEVDKLRATLDAVGAPVVVADAEFGIVDANRSAASMLGLRRRSVRRTSLFERLTPEELQTERIREDVLRNGSATFEASILHENAASDYVRVRAQAIDVSGSVRVVALLENTTPERELSAHYEHFLEQLIGHVPLEVCILSADGKYRYLSSSFLVDEKQRSWLIGRTDFDFCRESGIPTEIALRRRAHRLEAIDRGESVLFEEEVVLGGEPRHLSWRYVPFASDGEILMVLGFGLDETELVRCRQQLRESLRESEAASKLKDTLLQNVSHEIRTPLSAIIGTAQMLKTEVDPALRDFVVNVEENGRRLSETLNSMLDLADLQAESLDLLPTVLDATADVEDVVRVARPAAERRGLFLEYARPETEILLRADRDAFSRVVRNLVENAVKFTSEGGVVVDLSQRDDFAYVRVMDTGVGIGRSRHHDVFRAFQQEEDGLDRSFEGTGLGLAVTERLVRAMGGEVRVHSRKGSGSSFVVRLPLAMALLRRQNHYRPRVLIADPHPEVHRLIEHMMRGVYEFTSVYSFRELADLSSDHRYDAAIVDPGLDASRSPSDLQDCLRASPATAAARLILIENGSPGRRGGMRSGDWQACVEKPLTKRSLLNALYDASAMSLVEA